MLTTTTKAPKPKNPKQKRNKRKNPPTPSATMVTTVSAAPVSLGYNGAVKPPKYRSTKNGCVCLSHSELVGDVIGTLAFTPTIYSINAGLTTLFLWLSNIAANYESYIFKKLKFRYLPACATDNAGTVYVSVDFDPSDPAPVTERQLTNYQGTRFSAPWKATVYDCLSSNLRKCSSYYVRTGALNAGEDIGLTDVGNFIIATVGCAASTMGKLWVDYEVELSTPDFLQTAVGRALSSRLVNLNNFTTLPTVTGIAPVTATIAANVLTLTATQPYACLVAMDTVGTGLTTVATGGTANITTEDACVNAAGTQNLYTLVVLFAVGQTLMLSLTAPTTVTNVTIRLGQYDFANN